MYGKNSQPIWDIDHLLKGKISKWKKEVENVLAIF
jgi:hypothetical protein